MKYTEDKIDAYLLGEMSEAEKNAFEEEMVEEPSLAAEVNLMQSVVRSLKERQDKIEAMADWRDEKEYRAVAGHRLWVPWVTAFSTAAVLVVGIFLFRPSFSPAPTSSPDYLQSPPIMRGVDDVRLDSLMEAGEYQEVLDILEAEIAENEVLLQEGIRRRDEAEYEVRKYEYAIQQLKERMRNIEALKSDR